MKIFKKSLIAIFALMFLFIKPTGNAAGISSGTKVTNTFFGVTDDICAFWKAIFDFAIQIAGGIALVVVAIGGVLYLVSAGSTDRQKTAKDIMYGAGFGMILALTSWVLFTVLNPYILTCKIEVPTLQLATDPPYTGNGCGYRTPKGFATKEECEKDPHCAKDNIECVQEKNVERSGEIGSVVKSETTEDARWCCNNPAPGCPIDSPSVVACYGWRWWGDNKKNWHIGIDVYAGYGTPVVAITDGVADCREYKKNGELISKHIKFTDKNGTPWLYQHLGGCKSGSYKQGEVIGFVDGRPPPEGTDTGSSGPHLHFGKWYGTETNPLGTPDNPGFENCFNYFGSNCNAENCFAANCPKTPSKYGMSPPDDPTKPSNRMVPIN